MKRAFFLGLALSAPLLLAACDEGPSSNLRFIRGDGTWHFLLEATKAGPILVEVSGDPFGNSQDLVERAVLETLPRATPGRESQATAVAADAPRPELRVKLAFNGPNATGIAQCAGSVVGGGPAGAEEAIRVLASFCWDDGRLSTVEGWVKNVEGAEDKRFRELLRQVLYDLFQNAPQTDR